MAAATPHRASASPSARRAPAIAFGKPHRRRLRARPQRGQPGGHAAAVRRGRRHGAATPPARWPPRLPCTCWPSTRAAHPDARRARPRPWRPRTAPVMRGGARRASAARAWAPPCTAAVLEGERLVIAQVGDSRAYLLHQGKLQQLTRDHSLMADMIEAGQLTPGGGAHATRSARSSPAPSSSDRQPAAPTCTRINVETGDRLLHLLRRPVRHAAATRDIEAHHDAASSDPQRCAAQLVSAAIAAGGHDNVPVIVAERRRLRRGAAPASSPARPSCTIAHRPRAVRGHCGREPPGAFSNCRPEHRRLPGRPRRQGGRLPRRARARCLGHDVLAVWNATPT